MDKLILDASCEVRSAGECAQSDVRQESASIAAVIQKILGNVRQVRSNLRDKTDLLLALLDHSVQRIRRK